MALISPHKDESPNVDAFVASCMDEMDVLKKRIEAYIHYASFATLIFFIFRPFFLFRKKIRKIFLFQNKYDTISYTYP